MTAPKTTTLTLPSGLRVTLRTSRSAPPRERDAGDALFSSVEALVAERSAVLEAADGGAIDPRSLALRDFHTLRAVLTKLGLLAEEPIAITCRNCGEPLDHAPCAALELGPFVDDELDDPELDTPFDFDALHPILPIALRDGASAETVRLAPRTAEEALPLHRALARRRLRLTPTVVNAMGVVALGDETDGTRIARALARASERAFASVGTRFVEAHYPRRLFSIARCAKCGARNDVDAPYDREFEPSEAGGAHPRPARGDAPEFVPFEAFAARAEAIADELFSDADAGVGFVVDADVPACDDGGEPLLGSYVPGYEGDLHTPSRAPEVTVYFRTFRAIWDDEGPYDWDAELRETIEHELEHHRANLRGEDLVDEEERRQIAEEAAKIVGKRALVQREVSTLGRDILGFLRVTWPVWLLALIAVAITTLLGR